MNQGPWYGRDGSPLHKQAALAVSVFAQRLDLPLMIYGDTADLSVREKTSLYSYKEFAEPFDYVPAKLMSLQPRQKQS